MRYELDHKERTRKQIVSAAAQMFRKDGVVATGVVGLMKGVGLTQGGFYAHFESKEALIREALVEAMNDTADRFAKRIVPGSSPAEALGSIFDAYLSPRHAQHPEAGCALAAVGAELVREPPATRDAVKAATERLVDLVASHLPSGHADPHGLARAVFGLLSGNVQLARLTTDKAASEAILAGAKVAAMTLCGVGA